MPSSLNEGVRTQASASFNCKLEYEKLELVEVRSNTSSKGVSEQTKKGSQSA